jgi:hypothetical protein
MQTLHPNDQLFAARTAASERQRRADEFRTNRALHPERNRTNLRAAALSITVSAAVAFVGFSALWPAAATVAPPAVNTGSDTYTDLHPSLTPGLADGWFDPSSTTPGANLVPVDRVR